MDINIPCRNITVFTVHRINLLRKLNSLYVSPVILSHFYQSFIKSLLSFSFICWFHSLTVKDRNRKIDFNNSIVKIFSKTTGVKQRDLNSFCSQQILQNAASILASSGNVLASEFSLLPSGCRYVLPACKTNC